jgi:protein SDA1
VVGPATLFPLFFRLFRCPDKSLRQLLFSHIVHDISALNKKHRDERMNRSLQNFLYSMVNDENETAAKKSLAVLIELHKRQVWTDARSVNVVASACQHSKPRWVGNLCSITAVGIKVLYLGVRGDE